MNKLMSVVTTLFLMVGFAMAQSGTLSVTGTNLVDSTGSLLPSGTIYFAPVDNKSNPISYRIGGGGQSLSRAVSATISNGHFSIQLADTSSTFPTNVCFSASVIDNNTGESVLGGGYSCVQPTSSANSWCGGSGACNFDTYTPNLSANTLVQYGPTGPKGDTGCALGGSCTPVIIQAPSSAQTVIQPTGTTLGVNSLNKTQINLDMFSGANIGAKITAAQAFLGGANGVLSINTAGSIATAFTLLAGNDLQINAVVTNQAGVVSTLAGNNRLSCSSAGILTIATGSPFVSNSNNITIDHCHASGDATANASLLVTTGSAHIIINNLILTSIGTIHANGGSDLLVTGNTVTFPSGALAGYGAVWQGTSFVTVTGNHFYNVPNGAEFFNANADFNAGGPTSRAGVISAGAGHYVMSNNTCDHVAACMWGSVGYDVVITGNAANVCSDVCFDTEGSIDVVISANRAAEASNGGVSSFFYTENFLAQGNNISSSAGAPLMKIYNVSGIPTRNTGFVARGNKLTCLVVICPAFSNQAATNLTFEGNDITDGSYSLGDQSSNMSIKHNHFNTTFTAPSAWTAINTNAIINGGLLEIEDNTITGVTQPAGSICIANTSLDFNSTVTLRVIGNKCLGGFPIDLTTTNSGTNSSTGVITTLQGNWWSHNNVTHTHSTGNVDNYSELDKFIPYSGNWTRVNPNLKSTTGTRFICTDTSGNYVTSTTACSGT
jgi:hypothetical protein